MAQLLELEHLPIKVTARGAWLHGTTPLHPRVADLFARHVVPQPDGHYQIQLGASHHALEVEDTAFAVRSVDPQVDETGLKAVMLRLSDGSQEPLDPQTLMQSAENVLYCRVRRHDLAVPARFAAQQYHSLGLHVEQAAGQFCLHMAGRLWPIGAYIPAPVVLAEVPSERR